MIFRSLRKALLQGTSLPRRKTWKNWESRSCRAAGAVPGKNFPAHDTRDLFSLCANILLYGSSWPNSCELVDRSTGLVDLQPGSEGSRFYAALAVRAALGISAGVFAGGATAAVR